MLGELGADVTERRYFNDLPSEQEVRRLASLLPGGVHDLIATRGRKYRQMNLGEQTLPEEEWIDLLTREPGLWRRPVAVRGERVVVGYDEEALRELAS